MNNDTPMSMAKEADEAFRLASHNVVQRAKMFNTPVVIWEDGKIKEVSPQTLEKKLADTIRTKDETARAEQACRDGLG